MRPRPAGRTSCTGRRAGSPHRHDTGARDPKDSQNPRGTASGCTPPPRPRTGSHSDNPGPPSSPRHRRSHPRPCPRGSSWRPVRRSGCRRRSCSSRSRDDGSGPRRCNSVLEARCSECHSARRRHSRDPSHRRPSHRRLSRRRRDLTHPWPHKYTACPRSDRLSRGNHPRSYNPPHTLLERHHTPGRRGSADPSCSVLARDRSLSWCRRRGPDQRSPGSSRSLPGSGRSQPSCRARLAHRPHPCGRDRHDWRCRSGTPRRECHSRRALGTPCHFESQSRRQTGAGARGGRGGSRINQLRAGQRIGCPCHRG